MDSHAAAEWDELVSSHPDCTVFHCAAWGGAICETYGHKAFYLCLLRGDQPIALVPLIEIVSPITGRRGVCLPFSDACGPLVFREGMPAVLPELLQISRDRHWRYLEIREGRPAPEATPAAEYFLHSLRLPPNPEKLLQTFHAGARDAIRQGSTRNIAVEVMNTKAAIRDFYMLHAKTRTRHGAPPQPFRFFAKIQQHLIETGRGFVVMASDAGRPIAGAVFLHFGTKAIYKFAASDAAFTRTRANNLVIWEAMKHLIARGCQFLDFGRTSPANDGLRRFKSSWGAEEQMIAYHRFYADGHAPTKPANRENGLSFFFRRLPLPVNRLAGAILYPHLD